MSVLEIETFHLVDGTSDEAFQALDEQLATWRYVHRAGIRRRTTARSDEGQWLIDTWWDSAERANDDEVDGPVSQWRAMIDDASYERRLFATLD